MITKSPLARRATGPSVLVALALSCGALVAAAASSSAGATAPDPSLPSPTPTDTSPATTGPDSTDVSADGQTVVTWALLDVDENARDLRGISPSLSSTIFVPAGVAAAADGTMTVVYSAPEALERSAIELSVNGSTVDVRRLEPGVNELQFAIRADLLVPGNNVLALDASLHLDFDDDCPESLNVARRITILAGSKFAVPFSLDAPLSLAEGPEALVPPGIGGLPLTISLTEPDSGPALAAAATIARAVRELGGSDFPIVMSEGDGADAAGPTLVVDSRADAAPGVTIDRGPNRWPRLAIANDDPALLGEEARAIASRVSRSVLEGVSAESPAAPVPAPTPSEPSRSFSVATLGYDDRVMTGPRESGLIYQFDVPIAEHPSEIAVTVHAVLEAVENDRNIGLVVQLNGVSAGTLAFDPETGQLDQGLTIPASSVRSGTNALRLYADFGSRKSVCGRTTAPNQSISVRNDTLIELGPVDGPVALDLDDLPFTFRAAADAAKLTLVLPLEPSPDERLAAVELAALLSTEDHPARIIAPGEATPGEVAGAVSLVLLGPVDRQPLLDEFPLAFAVGADGAWPPSSGADRPTTHTDGSIQIVANPAQPASAVLTITGLTTEGALAAASAVLDVGSRGSMNGPVVLIGSDGLSVFSVPFAPISATQSAGEAPPVTAPPAVGDTPVETIGPESTDGGQPNAGTASSGEDAGGTSRRLQLGVAAALVLAVVAGGFVVVRRRRG
jgi:hypothetical protein